jgi:4'-phosphopantetheinyl transferase
MSIVHISTWSLAESEQSITTKEQFQLLDAHERQRLQALRRPNLTQRYLAAHAGLRQRLGRWLHMLPDAIRIATTPAGKPWLPDHPDCHFSLSHSHEFAMLGVADVPIGVDIEAIQKPEHLTPELIAQVLTAGEAMYLRSLPSDAQALCFTQHWVCKEAVMKATGLGFQLPPRHISVDLEDREDDGRAPRRATLHASCAEQFGRHWRYALVPAPAGHSAAVAATGSMLQICADPCCPPCQF